nr:MAG TPA: hypothetical protein [Caudoviricetes sp.]
MYLFIFRQDMRPCISVYMRLCTQAVKNCCQLSGHARSKNYSKILSQKISPYSDFMRIS